MAVARWVVLSLSLVLAAADRVSPLSRTRRNGAIIFFPDQVPPPPPVTKPDAPALELPESLNLNDMDLNSLSLINSIDNVTSFANLFGLDLPDPLTISVRFGAPREATMATCKPELQTVDLDLPVEASTIFYPTCVRLKQCGGCCYGPLLTCRPTKTTVVTLNVLKTVVTANSVSPRSRRRRQTEPSYHEVEVLEHEKCECGCKVQEQDCNPNIHTYLEGECACVCKNKSEKAACEQQSHDKYWDNKTCNCYCQRPVACSTGESFSPVSCRCEK